MDFPLRRKPPRASDKGIVAHKSFSGSLINGARRGFFPIHIAPLRERAEAVSPLAEHFPRKLNWLLDVQQILDATLLSEPRKNSTRSPRIMTYAEMKNLERENLMAALRATNYKI